MGNIAGTLWTANAEVFARVRAYKYINRYRMERNSRVWDDDSREPSPQPTFDNGAATTWRRFATSGGVSIALRNGRAGGRARVHEQIRRA